MGWSPKSLTIDWCKRKGVDLIPGDGYIPACVPAVVGTWALALARFGTMSFSQILQPAIELCEQGFPIHHELSRNLKSSASKFTEQYPSVNSHYLTCSYRFLFFPTSV